MLRTIWLPLQWHAHRAAEASRNDAKCRDRQRIAGEEQNTDTAMIKPRRRTAACKAQIDCRALGGMRTQPQGLRGNT